MKKLFSLLLITIILLTGCSKKDEKPETPSTPEIKYSHKIGDQVTLKDGTTWYVIENSERNSDTLTLFASQNIKDDASGWTTELVEYGIAFDEENSNIYANSTIKQFLDGVVTTYINNSLTSSGGTAINSIRLITTEEICNIINAAKGSNNCTLSIADYNSNGMESLLSLFTDVPTWLYSTYYWTMTPYASNSYYVYFVDDGGFLNYVDAYYGGVPGGARPVIVTLKSNIQ